MSSHWISIGISFSLDSLRNSPFLRLRSSTFVYLHSGDPALRYRRNCVIFCFVNLMRKLACLPSSSTYLMVTFVSSSAFRDPSPAEDSAAVVESVFLRFLDCVCVFFFEAIEVSTNLGLPGIRHSGTLTLYSRNSFITSIASRSFLLFTNFEKFP